MESIIEETKLTVNIYGYKEHPSGRKLVFKNELIETASPGDDAITEDSTLPKGERVIVNAAKTGYRYNLHKIVYQDGTEIERVKINSSYYWPVNAEIRIGTGAPASKSDSEIVANNHEQEEDTFSTEPEPTPTIELEPISTAEPDPDINTLTNDELPAMP